MSNDFDLVIRSGTIIDGCGDASFVGDVGIRDGLIVSVGRVDGTAAQEIDATGKLVTPGFVDVHTHYDGQVTWEQRLAPSSNHGVTTVVMGNCGVGFAPARPGDRQLMVKLMEGVEDIPEAVMVDGLPWNWETFPEYLDALEARETDIDFAAQLPHSPLRVYVMGERGAELEPPTVADLAEMRRLTKEAIQAGALGVTTSRNLAHRFRDGRPAPSVNTEKDELMALAQGLKDAGDGMFQLIPASDKPVREEWALISQLNETSGRPVNFSLFIGDMLKEDPQPMLDGLAEAAASGRAIHGQFMPRPTGMLFGLDLSYHLFSLNPSYREIAHLPLEEKVARMRDPEMRARLLAEQPDDPSPYFSWIIQQTHILFPLGDPPNYTPSPENSIKARAEALGIDHRELIYDELLKQDGHAILYCPMGNTDHGRFDTALKLFDQPNAVLGLGDGGAHYGLICDAAFPTFVLTEYVRRRGEVPLVKAIRMLTGDTAQSVCLNDRGLLKPGYKADLNIVDFDRLHLHAPRVVHDLPGGGKRLTQKSEGFDCTIVSGVVTYRLGQSTGGLPGRLIRGAKNAPAKLAAA